MQQDKPVAFYSSCKLTPAQQNYTTMDKELLSIVETFKELHTMLFDCHDLHVYTDHHNLTFNTLMSQWVIHWHQFQSHFHYIKGSSSTLADALSRLPACKGKTMDSMFDPSQCSPQERMSSFTALVHNYKLLQCMLNYPEIEMHEPFLLDYGYLSAAQSRDPQLTQKKEQDSEYFNWLLVAPQLRLIDHRKEPRDNPKICIPDVLLDKFIHFYHLALAHAGMNRVKQTMTKHFWPPNIMKQIEQYMHKCEICQKTNCQEKAMAGHLAHRQAQLVPWQEFAVDLIGWSMGNLNE